MHNDDSYKTIESHRAAEIKVNRSKFIANAYNIKSAEEAEEAVSGIKKSYYDARHHPYAYVLNDENIFRYNDDGEPGGSSGRPIYDAINKYGIKDVVVIVTRYFGGIKLGVGGLKRAYFESAEECLKLCKIIEIVKTKTVVLRFPYSYINNIMRYLEREGIKLAGNNSGEIAELVCEVRLSKLSALETELWDITKGNITAEITV